MGFTDANAAGSGIGSRAFEILVRQYHRRLLAYAFSLVPREEVAEDLVQEAFVSAYQGLLKFDPARDFGSWMRGIIRHKYLEWVRARREKTLGEELLDAVDRQHGRWDRAIEAGGEDPLMALRRCLEGLADRARRTIELFYLQRRPCAAVAVELGTSEVAIKKRLQRGREALARCIRDRLDPKAS